MKKINNCLKRLLHKRNKREQVEAYVMNETYKNVVFVKDFLDMRRKQCEENGIIFSLDFASFKNFETFGLVNLYYNGEKIETARLTRYYKSDSLCWKFNDEK
jgi:hypothetical protein